MLACATCYITFHLVNSFAVCRTSVYGYHGLLGIKTSILDLNSDNSELAVDIFSQIGKEQI